MKLSVAANIIIPAIQILKELGYVVTVSKTQDDNQLFTVEQNGNIFIADDPVTVLGLIKLYKIKDEQWQISDQELAAIGREYGLV